MNSWLRSKPAPPPPQVGCWDGTVALWRLQPEETADGGGGQGTEAAEPPLPPPPPATQVLLMHMKADPQPLRAVAWAPPDLAAEATGGLGRHVFLTAGHTGDAAIWDARCVLGHRV